MRTCSDGFFHSLYKVVYLREGEGKVRIGGSCPFFIGWYIAHRYQIEAIPLFFTIGARYSDYNSCKKTI